MSIKYDDERVKRPLQQIEFTSWHIQELARCKKDIWHFLKYVKIVNPDRGRVLFVPYDYQKEILRTFMNNRQVIVLSGRQLGKTTCVSVYATWYAIFNADKTIGIVSNKESSAKMILSRIQMMYEELPAWLKPGVKSYAKTSVEFDNGTKIKVSATSPDALRGESLSLLLSDELHFVEKNKCDAFWNSNYPTMSASKESKVFVLSTPNGTSGLFYTLYVDAETKRNTFIPLKYDWRAHPDRDEKWAEEQKKNMGELAFRQEHECEFIGSSSTVINPDTLKSIITKYKDPSHIDLNGRLKLYESPINEAKYVLGCDIGKGSGEHDSTIQVLRIDSTDPVKMKQVAVFKDNYTDVYDFSSIIHRVALYYNKAHVVVENNAEGVAVVNQLWWEYEYENLVNTGSKSVNLGIRATRKTKPTAVMLMKKLIENSNLTLVDSDTLNQLADFIEDKNGKFHGKNRPDDLVSGLYWAVYILEMQVFDEFKFSTPKDQEDDNDAWGILSDVNTENIEWDWLDMTF